MKITIKNLSVGAAVVILPSLMLRPKEEIVRV